METLFDFLIEIFKISILAGFYATLTLLCFMLVKYYKPKSWFARSIKRKMRFWALSGMIITVALYFFMATYWGNHGLGNFARLPIGHFKSVKQNDGFVTFIENDEYSRLVLDNFTYDDSFLYAETQNGPNGESGGYVVWNLRTDQWQYYKNKADYLKSVNENGNAGVNTFKDFSVHYSRHWKSWRFWLLP